MNQITPLADIKSITIKDLMSLEKVKIEFGKFKRIVLSAYNSSGKTALTMGIEILGYFAYPKEQANYIRDTPDEQQEFWVCIEFTDGQSIKFTRRKKGYYYTIKLLDGSELDTRFSNDKHIVMEKNSPPLLVKKLLNLIIEPEIKEELNIRRSDNGLLFVKTPGSVNYKSVYNALELSGISQAIKLLNLDKVSLNNRIVELASKEQVLHNQALSIRVFDSSELIKAHNEIHSSITRVEKLEQIGIIGAEIFELRQKCPPYIEVLRIHQLKDLVALFSLNKQLTAFKEELRKTPEIVGIDARKLLAMETISELTNKLMAIKNDITKTPELNGIMTQRFKDIETLAELKRKLFVIKDEVRKTKDIRQINTSKLGDIENIYSLFLDVVSVTLQINKNPAVQSISTSRITDLLLIKHQKDRVETGLNAIKKLPDLSNEKQGLEFSVQKLSKLIELQSVKNSIENTKTIIKGVETEYSALMKQLKDYENEIKSKGLTICPKCNNIFDSKETTIIHSH